MNGKIERGEVHAWDGNTDEHIRPRTACCTINKTHSKPHFSAAFIRHRNHASLAKRDPVTLSVRMPSTHTHPFDVVLVERARPRNQAGEEGCGHEHPVAQYAANHHPNSRAANTPY